MEMLYAQPQGPASLAKAAAAISPCSSSSQLSSSSILATCKVLIERYFKRFLLFFLLLLVFGSKVSYFSPISSIFFLALKKKKKKDFSFVHRFAWRDLWLLHCCHLHRVPSAEDSWKYAAAPFGCFGFLNGELEQVTELKCLFSARIFFSPSLIFMIVLSRVCYLERKIEKKLERYIFYFISFEG